MINPIVKRIFATIRAIGRGALKGAFPGVAGAVEAVRNIKGVKTEVVTPGGEVVTGTASPHNWWSIATSLLVGGVVLYGLFTKTLDVNQAIETLKYFFSE